MPGDFPVDALKQRVTPQPIADAVRANMTKLAGDAAVQSIVADEQERAPSASVWEALARRMFREAARTDDDWRGVRWVDLTPVDKHMWYRRAGEEIDGSTYLRDTIYVHKLKPHQVNWRGTILEPIVWHLHGLGEATS